MAFVYILKTSSGKYYVGSTTNVKNRLRQHQSGQSPATKRMGSPTLVFYQEYETLAKARSVEQSLKRLKRRDYLEHIIRDGYIKITPP